MVGNHIKNIAVAKKTIKTKLVHYSADNQTGHLEENCQITTFSQNKRFSSVFADRLIKFKYSTMQPLKFLKPFKLTWPIRKQPSNWWMLLHGPYAKKKLENLVFRKRCDCRIFFQVSRFECPLCKFEQSMQSCSCLLMKGLVSCKNVPPWSARYRLVLINKDWRDK